MNDTMEQTARVRTSRILVFLGIMRTWIVGALLCLTPPTSILVLGWLSGDMGRAARRNAGLTAGSGDRRRWLFGPPGTGLVSRAFGGLASNIRAGFHMAIGMFVMTLPFTGFWLSAWWAGWENSFNKGYEQAFVGPFLGLTGVGIFAIVMIYLPMAAAHQAVENRAFAFFELKRIRSAVAHSGWRYVMLAVVTVFFSLPIFASRGLPTFAESIYPGLAFLTASEVNDLRMTIDLFVAAYIFVSLVILRRWSARIYAKAVLRAGTGRDMNLWTNSALSAAFGSTGTRRPWRVFRFVQFAVLTSIWSGLAVLIFVGQFLNHSWHVWLTHPYFLLPWVM